MLEIIYQDEQMLAINKPHDLLVHPSPIARDAEIFALQMLRDQIGQHVYPAHRLDRKTAGVLLFGLSQEMNKELQRLFSDRKVQKTYHAIVRGYCADEGTIDYPLTKENGVVQEAFTQYSTLDRAELPVPFGAHTTSRYSLVKVVPETGRMHQIRKHFAHILHPIIGDRPHGCNKQNRLFKDKWNMTTMLLHASALSFVHPYTAQPVQIVAGLQDKFKEVMNLMGWGEDLLQL